MDMQRIIDLVQRAPLATFFVLAYGLAWGLVVLTRVSLVFGLLGLFSPAAAALIVTACVEGRTGVRALLARVAIWRVAWYWYLIALGLPAALSLGASALSLALGAPAALQFSELSPLALLLFVLVIGEELGWRGYALPQLQARFGALGASLFLGLLWAGWHLPNQLIPGLEFYGYGFPAFALYVVSMTVLFTWLANRTRGSVLLAWLFHGAINQLIFFNSAIDIVQRWWLSAAVYGLFAALIVLAGGLMQRGRAYSAAAAVEATSGN
jgi:membrane protease YdiL (CAAX protease family)